jgi:beta-glucosidase
MDRTFTSFVTALLMCSAAAALAQETRPVIDIADLTLEEKASLITGLNSWETHPVPRLGIPSVWMTDGPVGLRKSVGLKKARTVPATCFPSAAAMAATWNLRLIEQVGAGIGAEAHFNDVTLLLAPGLNLKRHPLGGRNFEYYSEDPMLSGIIAAAFVRGVQSRGVGATLKHFAVNNQEHRRMSIDAQVDERTMRELYLRGFEIAVKQSQPQAVMSAYNSVNGTFASQNRLLLTDILRGEWGFKGMVVSDWGAVDDPVASISAGLDLEMAGNPFTPPRVVEAVHDGSLEEADLDRAVAGVLQLVSRQEAMKPIPKVDATAANHELAYQVAVESMVLLANDGVLPIVAGSKKKVGVAGRLAFEPRIQGIGSSQVNPTRVEAPAGRIRELADSDGHELAFWEEEYSEDGLSEGSGADLRRAEGFPRCRSLGPAVDEPGPGRSGVDRGRKSRRPTFRCGPDRRRCDRRRLVRRRGRRNCDGLAGWAGLRNRGGRGDLRPERAVRQALRDLCPVRQRSSQRAQLPERALGGSLRRGSIRRLPVLPDF